MESQWRKERKRTWLLLVFVLLWTALAASMMPGRRLPRTRKKARGGR